MAKRAGPILRAIRWCLSKLATPGRLLLLPERRPLTIFFGLLALTFVFDVLGSFGLDDAGDKAWGEAISTLQGPVYRGVEKGSAQEKIVVVLIDDRIFRRNEQEGPPLGYAAQADVLARIAAEKPRAIFWDVHYPRSRLARNRQSAWAALTGEAVSGDPELDTLAQTMRTIGAERPLLIGPVSREDKGLAPIVGRLSPGAGPAGFARGLREVALEVEEGEGYPLSPGAAGKPPSAALALFWAYCATLRDGETCPSPMPVYGRPMSVQWGLGVSSWRSSTLPRDESARCESASWGITRLLRLLWQGLTREARGGERSDRNAGEQCGYHDVVYAADFDQLDPNGVPLRKLLEDKIVLVGFDLPAGGDRRKAPYYGDLPGVMTHAMAFDNLVQGRGRPGLEPAKIWGGLDEQDLLQYLGALLAVLLAILLSRNAQHLFRARERVLQRRRAMAGLVLAILALIGGSIMYYGSIRSWPLSSIVVGGLLPGGILGAALIFLARAGSGGNDEKPRRNPRG